MKKTLITLITMLVCIGMTSAEIIERIHIGQLYYNLDTNEKTAEVTYKSESIDNSYHVIYNERWNISEISIPERVEYDAESYNVVSIGQYAFHSCANLTLVNIPNSIVSIGNYAFNNCKNLTDIDVAENNQYFSSTNGVLFSKGKTTLLKYPSGKSELSYTIPQGVTEIGESSFSLCCNLTSIDISNSVVSVGNSAFAQCPKLSSVTMSSVNNIGNSAFYECVQLVSVTLGEHVTNIGMFAFYNCYRMASINIPDGVTCIKESTFRGCSDLVSIEIPNSVAIIEESAFYDCRRLSSVKMGNGVTILGDFAFYNCRYLESIELPESVTSIGKSTFYECRSLSYINIPNSVMDIGESAFQYSWLSSIVIPNNITNIKPRTFYDCSRLKSVVLGSSIKMLESESFAGCSSIDTITCYSQRPPTVNNAFENLDYSTIIFVPFESLNTYQMHDFWGLFDVRPIDIRETIENTILENKIVYKFLQQGNILIKKYGQIYSTNGTKVR